MKKYDFYLAGPFFNERQLKLQMEIEAAMILNDKTTFSPRLDAGTLGDKPTKKDMLDVFNADLEAINDCECLFANVSFRDTGTSVEIGYALAKGIPVVLFWDKDNNDVDHVNLMIALACEGRVLQSWEDVTKYLTSGTIADNEFQFKVE